MHIPPRLRPILAALLLASLAASGANPAQSAGTAFTYQGLLEDSGTSAASYDFEVELFDDVSGGTPVTVAPQSVSGVALVDGHFTLELDFGDVFTGPDRFLELSVRRSGEPGFTPLLPRQRLASSPYAQHADDADFAAEVAAGSVTATHIDAASVQRRVVGTCGIGQAMRQVDQDGGVQCVSLPTDIGDVTAVLAGSGLSGGGSAGDLTLAVNSAAVQTRIGTICTAGNAIRAVAEDGGVTCEPIPPAGAGDITSVGAGAGLQGGAAAGDVTLAVDFLAVQARVQNTCGAGEAIGAVAPDGSTACVPAGDITAVIAGSGLSGGASAGSATLNVDSGVVQNRVIGTCGVSQAIATVNPDGSVACNNFPVVPSDFWSRLGNAGTNPAADFLGTTDANAFEIRTNNLRSLRLEPIATGSTINLIAGASANAPLAGVRGATIAGGGTAAADVDFSPGGAAPNRVLDSFGSVGGGLGNEAGLDDGDPTLGAGATVGGGAANRATALASVVAGGRNNLAAGVNGTIGGGNGNDVTGTNGTVAGGENNSAGQNDFVGGGASNSASGGNATVGGGASNLASQLTSTVGGGVGNTASAQSTTIAGGSSNAASGTFASIGGGNNHIASGSRASIGGGNANTASAQNASVGGGISNTASGLNSTVSGGSSNSASGGNTSVAGGLLNTASNSNATVAGGASNSASGSSATVAGGNNNCAGGTLSLAAGNRAKVRTGTSSGAAGAGCSGVAASGDTNGDEGSFVWADASNFDFASTAPNQFSVRSVGGARVVTAIDGSGVATAGVKLDNGDSAWEVLSDRNSKAGIQAIDPQDVLARVLALPIYRWHYRAQSPSIQHLGPMAQDFHTAFDLNGDDNKSISTIDPDGVALAAIQGLNARLEAETAALRAELAELRTQLRELRTMGAKK